MLECDVPDYLGQVAIHHLNKRATNFILWRLQNIVEEDIYRVKVELWPWGVVISFKLDNILISLAIAVRAVHYCNFCNKYRYYFLRFLLKSKFYHPIWECMSKARRMKVGTFTDILTVTKLIFKRNRRT